MQSVQTVSLLQCLCCSGSRVVLTKGDKSSIGHLKAVLFDTGGGCMKRIFTLAIVGSLIALSSNANAWFFFWIPGSVTSAIGDAFTGAEGQNCVGPNAKVGDTIRLPNGSLMTIKSLSGTSGRCTNPEHPIRALLEPSAAAPTQYASNARIDLSDGWESLPLSEAQKIDRVLLFAINKTTESVIQLSTTKHSDIADMQAFAVSKRANQASRSQDAQSSEITQLVINGLPAWRYEVTGKIKSGIAFTTLTTIFESNQEIVIVNIATTAARFPQQKESLLKIVDSLTGLSPPFDPVKEAEAKKKIEEEEASKVAAAEEAKRIAAEENAKQAKAGPSKKTENQTTSQKLAASTSQQLDFNVEANKAARILGCQPLEVKVTGAEGGNILYLVACENSKTLNLSCDPSGLCLQKKGEARSKR